MLQVLHACMKGNARRTSKLLNLAPPWGNPPSTRLHLVAVKLVPQIRLMHDQAQQLLQDSDSPPLDGHKGGWAGFMFSAWRKMKSIPPVECMLMGTLVNQMRLKLQLCVNIGG
eukprot:3746071-Amphidinium_carterae.1